MIPALGLLFTNYYCMSVLFEGLIDNSVSTLSPPGWLSRETGRRADKRRKAKGCY